MPEETLAESDEIPYNPAEAGMVAARKAASGRRRKRRFAALEALMSHPQGRELVWDMLTDCGIFRTSFDANPVRMAFNEGNRNAGLRLMSDVLKAAPEHFKTMQQENANG